MTAPLLRHIYDRVGSFPGLETPEDLASRLRADSLSMEEAVERAVALHVLVGAGQGFLFGLPGWLLLPVTLPANLASAAVVQLRLTMTLATLGGSDLRDPDVRDRCINCVLRGSPLFDDPDEEEALLARTISKFAERGVRWTVGRIVRRASRARSLPLVGGVLGGATDAWSTHAVATCAAAEFLEAASAARDGSPQQATAR